jgi:hypothetical protein
MISLEQQKRVQEYAEGFLQQGRIGWDLPHTKAVVDFALLIAAQEGLDQLTLFTAAWFHDIGYYGLFANESSDNLAAIGDRKKLHMVRGAEYAGIFLANPYNSVGYLPEQILRVQHLISVHDKVEELQDPYEIALGAADTLGALDVSQVTPTLNYAEYQKYLSHLQRRERLFQTEFTKKLYRDLLPLFVAFFENRAAV